MASYDTAGEVPWASESIHIPGTTWAEGRNILLGRALLRFPDTDYFIFCDHDVRFAKGGFVEFEACLARTCPRLGIPLMPKARVSQGLDPALEVQRAITIDEQMVALHTSTIGMTGLAPIVSEFDSLSWYVACLIFEYVALHDLGRLCHQFNNVEVRNDYHSWLIEGTKYKQGAEAEYIPAAIDYLRTRYDNYDPELLEPYYAMLHIGPTAQESAKRTRERRLASAGQVSTQWEFQLPR